MLVFALLVGGLLLQQPPVPQPFPRTGPAQPSRPATPPAAPPQPTPAPAQSASNPDTEAAPKEAMLGAPIFPNAQFLGSYDAGRGQRFYLFGSTASFLDLVTYYR